MGIPGSSTTAALQKITNRLLKTIDMSVAARGSSKRSLNRLEQIRVRVLVFCSVRIVDHVLTDTITAVKSD